MNDIPPGNYRICADIQSQALLNTCRWGAAPVATIGPGSTNVAVATIRFSAGAKLHVRVNDSIGALQSAAGKSSALEFGVSTTTGFLPLGIVSTNAGGIHPPEFRLPVVQSLVGHAQLMKARLGVN